MANRECRDTTISRVLRYWVLSGLIFVSQPSWTSEAFESVVKDAAFRAALDLPSDGAFAALEDGVAYYRMHRGDPCDTPDVLVHGFSVPSYIWDPTYDFLAAQGRCVVMLDLYGRGFSDNPDLPYTDTLFAKQVLALLDHLAIERASFFGLSNGGRVITQLAGMAPERVEQLIYIASSGFRDVARVANAEVTAEEISALIASYPELPAGQLSDFKDPSQFQNWDDQYAELLVHQGFARALISTRKHHDSAQLDLYHAQLQSADMPVTTIWGDSDTVVVYADFADKIERLLPRRREYFVPDSGHLPHMENPEYVEAILSEVLGL